MYKIQCRLVKKIYLAKASTTLSLTDNQSVTLSVVEVLFALNKTTLE